MFPEKKMILFNEREHFILSPVTNIKGNTSQKVSKDAGKSDEMKYDWDEYITSWHEHFCLSQLADIQRK